jgi:aromatic-L-amino-acid/L-tryptophan decarboxylase
MVPPSHFHINNGAPQNGPATVLVVEPEPDTEQPQWARMLDAEEFRRLGHQVVGFIADYYAGMENYPVHPGVTPGFLRQQLPADAPSRPEPDAFAAAMKDVRDLILPGMTH